MSSDLDTVTGALTIAIRGCSRLKGEATRRNDPDGYAAWDRAHDAIIQAEVAVRAAAATPEARVATHAVDLHHSLGVDISSIIDGTAPTTLRCLVCGEEGSVSEPCRGCDGRSSTSARSSTDRDL